MLFTVKDALIVADILRDAAKAEIMPRWRSLSSEAIRQKTSPLDLVTDADEAAERVIGAALARAFPGAAVIGEDSESSDAGAGVEPGQREPAEVRTFAIGLHEAEAGKQ